MASMKFLGADQIACFSPHPDDCEYAVAGTIMKYQSTTFYIFNFSSGGKFSDNKKSIDRINEVKNFWSRFNNVKLKFLDLNYIRDLKIDFVVSKLDKIFNNYSFDFILIPITLILIRIIEK